MASVPREERPTPEDLEGYTESKYEPDPDLSLYMHERHIWLYDWRRAQEEKRDSGREPLALHGDPEQSTGYDKNEFFLRKAVNSIRSRPLH